MGYTTRDTIAQPDLQVWRSYYHRSGEHDIASFCNCNFFFEMKKFIKNLSNINKLSSGFLKVKFEKSMIDNVWLPKMIDVFVFCKPRSYFGDGNYISFIININ